MSPRQQKRYPNIQFSQFMGAEMVAAKYGLTKDQLDEYAYNSHQKAIAATQGGAFKDEIVAIEITDADGNQDPAHRRRGHPLRRQPRRHQGREAAARRRRAHRRHLQPDLRRRLGRDGRQRGGPEDPGRRADGPHPPPDGDRRRSGDHAGSPDPGHQAGAGEGRHVDRRHRPLRGQRGLRLGAGGLAARSTGADPDRSSTSTAAPSPSATRWAPRAPS